MKKGLMLIGVFLSVYANVQQIELETDNIKLQKAFNWAVNKALSFRMTGKKVEANKGENGPTIGYKSSIDCIPSYWAGYTNRTAFYSRDFSRQSLAAHLLGMDEENFSMFEAFAKHCTVDKNWYTWWALNFDGTVYTLDAPNPPGESYYEGYPSDFENLKGEHFVREIPANFNLIYNSYKCYLWTGDNRYITNSHLKKMREKSMNDFILLHDSDGNGIPEGKGDIWVGSSTYNERELHPKESGDAISLMYAARLAYAGFLEAEEKDEAAIEERLKARYLYDYFNNVWSGSPKDSMFISAVLQNGQTFNGFSKESTFLMPIYGITEPGEKTNKLLELVKEQIGDGFGSENVGPSAMKNIEAYTYLPQLFFAYNRADDAYKYMSYIIDNLNQPHEVSSQGTNGDYPEIPFTMISHIVEGMMGVEANFPQSKLYTVSCLPKNVSYATISNLKVGSSQFSVSHTKESSTLNYEFGDRSFIWEAAFYGDYPNLVVDGNQMKTFKKNINGNIASYVQVLIKAGEKIKIEL